MEATKKSLEDIIDVLYKGEVTKGIAMMSEVIPSLAVIAEKIEDEELKDRYINDGLRQALEAMETNDGVLLADVLSYEIIEIIDML